MKISVIVSTYNKPDWLKKVLWGYSVQNTSDFELIIADDGSGNETKELINSFKENFPVEIKHVWHDAPDYQRQKILNKAIVGSSFDYILFSDGDCIPRADFVSEHIKLSEKGRFLSGGYCKLPMETSLKITKYDIEKQNCFDTNWLKNIEKLNWRNNLKLSAKKWNPSLMDFLTPSKPTFNNCNSSAWKKDLIDINGYDERMKYGGPDRELGERLENNNIKGKSIRYQAICLHLDHERGYENKESWQTNYSVRKEVKQKKLTWTDFGISKK